MWGAIIAVVVLATLGILVIRGTRGHPRSNQTSETLDGTGTDGSTGGD